MRLSDVVGSAGLSVYAEVALVIFFFTFVGIVLWTFARRNKARYEEMRRLPLDERASGTGATAPSDEQVAEDR